MSVKPILFNTEMVRAILDGRKTVTRRIVKPQPVGKLAYCMAGYKHGTWGYPSDDVWKYWGDAYKRDAPIPEREKSRHWTPPCHTDDVLWVREMWCFYCGVYWHKAGLEVDENGDCKDGFLVNDISEPSGKKWVATKAPDRWRPSIHMPREAARIWLRVTDVRVERLQEIDGDGLRAEGFDIPCLPNEVEDQFNKYGAIFDLEQAKKNFSALWDSTIKPMDRERYGWAANPWVWVIEFEKCKKPEEDA